MNSFNLNFQNSSGYVSQVATVVKISPDGTKFFVGADGSLYLYNLSDSVKLDRFSIPRPQGE